MNDDGRKGPLLTGLARAAIARRLGIPRAEPDAADAPWLHEPGASFVTLHEHGRLRGCIGSLHAHRPLIDDVRENAVAAAFHDPRFPPLAPEEFDRIDIEVSVLSTPEPIAADNEPALLAQLEPGRDGLILQYGAHRATFLPQVWEQLPDPALFVAQLKQKAGLPPDFWHPDMQCWRYRVEAYAEAKA